MSGAKAPWLKFVAVLLVFGCVGCKPDNPEVSEQDRKFVEREMFDRLVALAYRLQNDEAAGISLPFNMDDSLSFNMDDSAILKLLGTTTSASPEKHAVRWMSRINQVRQIFEEQASEANLSIELDASMDLGEEHLITFLMQGQSKDGSTGELDEMANRIPAQTFISDTVTVMQSVGVSLVATDFEIDEVKAGWQNVIPEHPTLWIWKVTPRSTGTKTIMFVLEHKIPAMAGGDKNYEDYIVPVNGYPRTVVVQVGLSRWAGDLFDRIGGHIGWLLAALVTILGGFASAAQISDWLRNRKKGKSELRPDQSPAELAQILPDKAADVPDRG